MLDNVNSFTRTADKICREIVKGKHPKIIREKENLHTVPGQPVSTTAILPLPSAGSVIPQTRAVPTRERVEIRDA